MDQKRIKKAWGNGGLIFRDEVSRLLSEHGFVADPLDTNARYLAWSRPLKDGIGHEISFDCFEDNGKRYFRSGLAIFSSRVHSVLEEIKYLECSGGALPIKPPNNTCILFAGDVEWWAEYYENQEVLLTERAYRQWPVLNEPLRETEAWYRAFVQYGLPLLESLDTPAKVIDFLQHLEKFPRRMGGARVCQSRDLHRHPIALTGKNSESLGGIAN